MKNNCVLTGLLLIPFSASAVLSSYHTWLAAARTKRHCWREHAFCTANTTCARDLTQRPFSPHRFAALPFRRDCLLPPLSRRLVMGHTRAATAALLRLLFARCAPLRYMVGGCCCSCWHAARGTVWTLAKRQNRGAAARPFAFTAATAHGRKEA